MIFVFIKYKSMIPLNREKFRQIYRAAEFATTKKGKIARALKKRKRKVRQADEDTEHGGDNHLDVGQEVIFYFFIFLFFYLFV